MIKLSATCFYADHLRALYVGEEARHKLSNRYVIKSYGNSDDAQVCANAHETKNE